MYRMKEAKLYYYRTVIPILPKDQHDYDLYKFPEFDAPDDVNDEVLQQVCNAIGYKAGYSPTNGISFPQSPDNVKHRYIPEEHIVLPNGKEYHQGEFYFFQGKGWTVIYEPDYNGERK